MITKLALLIFRRNIRNINNLAIFKRPAFCFLSTICINFNTRKGEPGDITQLLLLQRLIDLRRIVFFDSSRSFRFVNKNSSTNFVWSNARRTKSSNRKAVFLFPVLASLANLFCFVNKNSFLEKRKDCYKETRKDCSPFIPYGITMSHHYYILTF